MSRDSRLASETVPMVAVGDVDPMSRQARLVGLPLCGRKHRRDRTAPCTRLAGHAETGSPHPAALHVTTGPDSVAKDVWFS